MQLDEIDQQLPTDKLFFTILMNYFKNEKLVKYLSCKDFIDLYYITYYQCLKKFDSNKNTKFSTYMYTSVINRAKKILKKKTPVPFSQLSKDSFIAIYDTVDENLWRKQELKEIGKYLIHLMKKANLSDSEIKLLHDRYVKDRSGADIAKTEKVTRQAISHRLDRIKDKLRKVAELDGSIQFAL